MAQRNWIPPISLEGSDDALLHEAIPAVDPGLLAVDLLLDLADYNFVSSRDLRRARLHGAGFDYAELAEREGVSTDAIKMSIYRVRVACRALIT